MMYGEIPDHRSLRRPLRPRPRPETEPGTEELKRIIKKAIAEHPKATAVEIRTWLVHEGHAVTAEEVRWVKNNP